MKQTTPTVWVHSPPLLSGLSPRVRFAGASISAHMLPNLFAVPSVPASGKRSNGVHYPHSSRTAFRVAPTILWKTWLWFGFGAGTPSWKRRPKSKMRRASSTLPLPSPICRWTTRGRSRLVPTSISTYEPRHPALVRKPAEVGILRLFFHHAQRPWTELAA